MQVEVIRMASPIHHQPHLSARIKDGGEGDGDWLMSGFLRNLVFDHGTAEALQWGSEGHKSRKKLHSEINSQSKNKKRLPGLYLSSSIAVRYNCIMIFLFFVHAVDDRDFC